MNRKKERKWRIREKRDEIVMPVHTFPVEEIPQLLMTTKAYVYFVTLNQIWTQFLILSFQYPEFGINSALDKDGNYLTLIKTITISDNNSIS